MFVFILIFALLMIHQGECEIQATTVLYADNSYVSYGSLTFKQRDANSPVQITGLVSGLNASSSHGFHVHANPVAETKPNCTAAGPHFNPYNTSHGPRTADIRHRHVGDLGNLTTDADGKVYVNMNDSIIQFYNVSQSIINRTIVIHLFRDDGGQGGFMDSNTTGNAGARILCGLIKESLGDMMIATQTFRRTPSVGLRCHPILFVILATIFTGYII